MAFIQMAYISQALGREVSVKVILPSDGMCGQWEPPYKTLYFLPGYSATATQLITYLGLRNHSELKGIAIVLPDGENAFYQDLPDRMTFYSTFVGKELVEITRKLLPLSEKREDTYIAGISMGGYGALYNGMKYRQTFSKVVAFSPACDPYSLLTKEGAPGFSKEQFTWFFGDRDKYLQSDANIAKAWCECPQDERPELFICCGTNDRVVYKDVELLENYFKECQMQHVYLESPGDHEIYYWEQMLDPAFSFLAGIEPGTKDKVIIPF